MGKDKQEEKDFFENMNFEEIVKNAIKEGPKDTDEESTEENSEDEVDNNKQKEVIETEGEEKTAESEGKNSKDKVDDEQKAKPEKLEYDKRVDRAEKYAALKRAEEAETRVAQLEQAIVQREKLTNEAIISSNEAHIQELTVKKDILKTAKISAAKAGEFDKVADMEEALSNINYQLHTLTNNLNQLTDTNKPNINTKENAEEEQVRLPQHYIEAQRDAISDYLTTRSFLDQNSESFFPELYNVVSQKAVELEQYCNNNRRPDLIASKEYFDTLDDFIADTVDKLEQNYKAKNTQQDNQEKHKDSNPSPKVPYKPSYGPQVGGVRSGAVITGSNNKSRVNLNEVEKNLAKQMGLKEEEWAFHKQELRGR